MAIATALIAAGIGAAGAIGGALINKSATKKATDASTAATTANNALQASTYAANASRLDPYGMRGNAAGDAINALLLGGKGQGAAFNQFRNSTGYDFRVSEGNKAVNTGFAGKGLLQSGAAMKALTKYGQNTASGEFGNYLDQLRGQQNTGLAGASALAGVGQNMANSVSQNNSTNASNIGNAALAGASNNNALIGGLVNTAGQFLGNGSSFGGGAAPTINWAGMNTGAMPGIGWGN